MTLQVGVCWPTPGTEAEPLPFDLLDRLMEATKATHLRIDLHHRKPGVDEMVQQANDAGFTVLPILDFDYEHPELELFAGFCDHMVRRHGFPAVEIGNEPYILHKMPAELYARVFNAGAKAIRETGIPCQIYMAAEATKPIAHPIDMLGKVLTHVDPELWDCLAIHPYRNPMPPAYSPMGGRKAELEWYQGQVPTGKGIVVTEVGWDLRDGVDLDRQGQYILSELHTWETLGVDGVYIYQHTDPPSNKGFGIFDHEWNERPAAEAIKLFQRRP